MLGWLPRKSLSQQVSKSSCESAFSEYELCLVPKSSPVRRVELVCVFAKQVEFRWQMFPLVSNVITIKRFNEQPLGVFLLVHQQVSRCGTGYLLTFWVACNSVVRYPPVQLAYSRLENVKRLRQMLTHTSGELGKLVKCWIIPYWVRTKNHFEQLRQAYGGAVACRWTYSLKSTASMKSTRQIYSLSNWPANQLSALYQSGWYRSR